MIDPHLALEALVWMVGWNGGYVPVYLDGAPAPAAWWPVPARAQRTARRLIALDRLDSRQVELGLPVRRVGMVGPATATIVWARVAGKDQLERARARHPLPSLVIQEGDSTRRLLIWSLEAPLEHARVQRANRRLAYHFHARQLDGDPDHLRIPAPGTFLRGARPTLVSASRLSTTSFPTAGWIAGHLRDPPAPRYRS
jgi:hypothetical protein